MSVGRGLGATAGALLAATLFLLTAPSLPTPPLSDPAQVEGWWRSNGTAVAAFSIVRVGGLALSAYVAVLGVMGTVAALTRWSWADAVWERCATPAFRRMLVGGGLVAGLSVPTVGAATSPAVFAMADIGPLAADFELVDLGPLASDFELIDLGPVPTHPSTTTTSPPLESQTIVTPALSPGSTAAESATVEVEHDEWTVVRGDHLWSIAAETLADRGGGVRESDIARYWLRLIDHNHDLLGDHPDLIYPGQIILLPD